MKGRPVPRDEGFESRAQNAEAARILASTLLAVCPGQAEAVLLYVEGATYDVIGTALGITRQAAFKAVEAGLAKMRRSLEAQGIRCVGDLLGAGPTKRRREQWSGRRLAA